MLGYGNGVFGFGHNVTREQVAALIYRALDLDEEFGEDEELESPYNDIVDDNSTMFPFEVLAVTELGIFTGEKLQTKRYVNTCRNGASSYESIWITGTRTSRI